MKSRAVSSPIKLVFDTEEEEEYLAIIDRGILDSEDKIQLLLEEIDVLRVQGADMETALALLTTADEILIIFKIYRAQVLKRLKQN